MDSSDNTMDFIGFDMDTTPNFPGFSMGISHRPVNSSNQPLTSTWNDTTILRTIPNDSNNSSSDSNTSDSSFEQPSIEEPMYLEPLPPTEEAVEQQAFNNNTMNISGGPIIPQIVLSKKTTSKGKDKFFLEPYGFEYVFGYYAFKTVNGVKVKSNEFIYYRCKNHQKEEIKCKAKLRVPYDYHNSNPDSWILYNINVNKPITDGGHSANCICQVGKRCADELIRACKDEGLKHPLKNAKTILDEKRTEMVKPGTPTEWFPSDELIIKQINHARKDHRIRLPHNMEELLVHQVSENAPGFSDFYRADVKVRGKRHFIFFTNDQLTVMRTVTHFKLDGTFKIVLHPLYQLFSIHGYGNTADQERQNIPLCFIAMSGKRAADYAAVFGELKKLLEADGNQINLTEVLIDFEAAIWKALVQIFGSTLTIRGCWFHFCQAVYKKIKKEGMANDFYLKRPVYQMGRELMCLAFIEPGNVIQLFEYLKQVYRINIAENEPIRKLFQYFEKYWILGFFSPEKWNCYKEEVRTTNELENWNYKIWKNGGQKKHNLYSLGNVLHKEAIKCIDRLNYIKSYTTKTADIQKKNNIKKVYYWYDNNPTLKFRVLRKFVRAVTPKMRWNSPERPWVTEHEDLEDIESLLELDDE